MCCACRGRRGLAASALEYAGREPVLLSVLLKVRGLESVPVAGDGLCFFPALAHVLMVTAGDRPSPEDLYKQAMAQLAKDRALWEEHYATQPQQLAAIDRAIARALQPRRPRTILRCRRRRAAWARRAVRPRRPPENTPLPFAGVGGAPVAFIRRCAAEMSRGKHLARSAGASPKQSGSLHTCATSAVVWRRRLRRWDPPRGAQLVRTLLDAQRGVRVPTLWVATAATTLRAKEETAARAAGKELLAKTPASSLRQAAYHGFAHGWGPADKANRPLPCCVL
jgi:hypothetical protein